MAMHIRVSYDTGSNLGYSIERLSDGKYFDFSSLTFVEQPKQQIKSLPEATGIYKGCYITDIQTTPPNVFTNGHYTVYFHDGNDGNKTIANRASHMIDGDDLPGSTVIVAKISYIWTRFKGLANSFPAFVR